jgi:hypothetical protein
MVKGYKSFNTPTLAEMILSSGARFKKSIEFGSLLTFSKTL